MKVILTRIRFRILGIVLLAIIPAMALIWYSAAQRKQQVSEEIENNARRLSRFLASNLERDISEGRGFLNVTAELMWKNLPAKSECSAVFARLLEDSSVYSNMGISKSDGSVVCSAYPIPANASLLKLNWFHKVMETGTFTVGFDFGGVFGRGVSLNMAVRLPGREERILFLVMGLDWLNKLAEKSQLPNGSALSVTNEDGSAIARYPDPDNWVGKPYPRGNKAKMESGQLNGVMLAEGIDGINRLYAFAPVSAEGNLVVRVGIQREAIYAPANRALRNHLLALACVSLLALLAAWFASDVFLLKQVKALIAAVKTLGSGNLAARSRLAYDHGELGELARAFDEMAETLEWREAQLRESETERVNPANLFDLGEIDAEALLVDKDLKIAAATGAIQEILGYQLSEILGRPLLVVFPDIAPHESVIQTFLESQVLLPPLKIRPARKWKTKEGNSLPVEISLSKSILGKGPFVVILIRAIVETRFSEEA